MTPPLKLNPSQLKNEKMNKTMPLMPMTVSPRLSLFRSIPCPSTEVPRPRGQSQEQHTTATGQMQASGRSLARHKHLAAQGQVTPKCQRGGRDDASVDAGLA